MSADSVARSAAAAPAPIAGPEKTKLILQQAVLIVHAQQCQRREKQSNDVVGQCSKPYCNTLKNVLRHQRRCSARKSCPVPYCSSSRDIISHWRNCFNFDCPICVPLIQSSVREKQAVNDQVPQCSRQNLNNIESAMTNQSAQNFLLTENLQSKVKAGNVALINAPPVVPDSFLHNCFIVKEWHHFINQDLRHQMVRKIILAIFPTAGIPTVDDTRMINLVSYARKIEGDMYSFANSRKEYYEMISRKIFHILKEHRKKRQEKEEMQLQQVGPGLEPMIENNSGAPSPSVISQPHLPSLAVPGNRQRMTPPNITTTIPTTISCISVSQFSSPLAKQMMNQQQQQQPPLPLNVENISLSQDSGISSVNQTDTNRSNMPISSVSDQGSVHTGGKVFAFALQKSVGDSSSEKMDVETSDIESGSGKSEKVMDFEPTSKNYARIEIKQEPEDGGYATGSSLREEPVIKEEPLSPQSLSNSAESNNKEPDSQPPPKMKPMFKPDKLRQVFMPSLEKLYMQDPESLPFRDPVNPELLQIPDYFDIIKRPMDLSTIKRKLDTGLYQDPWQYVEDVWLMFDNAWLYNRKASTVYGHSTKLAEIFKQEIDPVMKSLGYCCGRKYVFQPQVLCCYGKQLCTIPRDAKYWSYQNRYTYCLKCFLEIPGDTVTLGDDPTQTPMNIKKDEFIEKRNDHLEPEPFVECLDCGRKLHKICAVYFEPIWPEGFTCDNCLKSKGKKRKENKFRSKRLQQSKLGQYIENRVNNFLKKNCGAGEVTIRVVSSSEKYVEVEPGMKARYVNNGYWPEKFPYKAKALFAFQEIDGVDICFFGMHVQEYGSECPMPNTRRVYIAYLDSVHFFRPKQFRTAVYHEIILGYLEYAKQLGYTMAHIWACPPTGEDYIFHSHPTEQKIPKPKRLQEWYKKMLDKGVMDRIVIEYKDILKQTTEENLKSASEFPYFEGDFWPNILEEIIKELNQKKDDKRKVEVSGAPANKKPIIPYTDKELFAKFFSSVEKYKEEFLVVRLHSIQAAASLPPIVDPDPFISCDMMDSRDSFLTSARKKHYEFSNLRRTKFSTMAMLYELHNQSQDRFFYTCNNCKKHVETRYHCTICNDLDLCVNCFEQAGHNHKMEKFGFGLDDDSATCDQKQMNPQESRLLSIQRCIKYLLHACQCRDANCRLPSCRKMIQVLQHSKSCQLNNSACPICRQLRALCCYHAKQCEESMCPVSYCSAIKSKIKDKELEHHLQQAKNLRRRIAMIRNRGMSDPVCQGSSAYADSSNQPSSSHAKYGK